MKKAKKLKKAPVPPQLFEIRPKETGWDHKAKVLVPIALKDVRVKHGVESGFYVDEQGRGIKTFYSLSDAKYSHTLQSRAAKQKAAPKVLSKPFPIIVSAWGGEAKAGTLFSKYAYRTQVAQPLRSTPSDKAFDGLDARLKKARVSNSDLHNGNMGLVGNTLVRVDFGRIST